MVVVMMMVVMMWMILITITGIKRTLDQLIDFTGIDIRNKVIYADR
jgi:hypothetical protein